MRACGFGSGDTVATLRGLTRGGVEIRGTVAIRVKGGGPKSAQSIFDFLSDWAARDILADFDDNGAVTLQDLFLFLADWNAGV